MGRTSAAQGIMYDPTHQKILGKSHQCPVTLTRVPVAPTIAPVAPTDDPVAPTEALVMAAEAPIAPTDVLIMSCLPMRRLHQQLLLPYLLLLLLKF